MTRDYAMNILEWKYESPYDFYNNELTTESLNEFLENSYYAIFDKENLIGFFCLGKSAQVPIGNQYGAYSTDKVDIGLGMRPGLTGKGYGKEFLMYILNHIDNSNPDIVLRLTVAEFNQRAIHLYKKFGFEQELEFLAGTINFITMVRNT